MSIAKHVTGRPKKSHFDWLKDQLHFVSEWGEAAGLIAPTIHHDYEVHTALKLAALNHAVGVFSPIARAQVEGQWRYKRSVFVDLFAGSGATRTPRGDWLAGSPIIAAKAKKPFDLIVLAETNPERLSALKKRVGAVLPDSVAVNFVEGDCNINVKKIVELLRPDDLAFICVDPEGMEIHWLTLQELVRRVPASDLFINVTSGVDRVIGAMRKDGSGTSAMEQFTGVAAAEMLADLRNGDRGLLELYSEKVGHGLGKQLGGSAEVSAISGHAVYTLLLRTRLTARGSPYTQGYVDLQTRLRSVDARLAERALDQLKRGQQSFEA